MNAGFWQGKRVLVTGHTGFKGSWLVIWLKLLGADVIGYSSAALTHPNLFQTAQVSDGITSITADVTDLDALKQSFARYQPEIVFHLAAQPIVRRSYQFPVETFATNVMGTVHFLEAIRLTPSVKAGVIVTSDKCYNNREWIWGYREDEALGGHDPYSSSKGCAELVTQAYRASFFEANTSSLESAIASARAGNVIGGGDWAQDRLIPDMVRAFSQGLPVTIRHPHAIRPWQHVLEPLRGYLLLAAKLYTGGSRYAGAWNFGPDDVDTQPVSWLVEKMTSAWGEAAAWQLDCHDTPHEANYLKLDCSKAKSQLGWIPHLSLSVALDWTVKIYKSYYSGQTIRNLIEEQIYLYQSFLEKETKHMSYAIY